MDLGHLFLPYIDHADSYNVNYMTKIKFFGKKKIKKLNTRSDYSCFI